MTLADALQDPDLGIPRRNAIDEIDRLRQVSSLNLHRLLATVTRYLDGQVSARELAATRDDVRRCLDEATTTTVRHGGTT